MNLETKGIEISFPQDNISIEKKEKTKVGVYFLFKNNKIVYVGQSRDIESRVYAHIKDKDFDFYNYIPYMEEMLDNEEAFWIFELNPIYNKNIPHSNTKYISERQLKDKFNIGKVMLRRFIRDNNVRFVTIKNTKYFKKSDLYFLEEDKNEH